MEGLEALRSEILEALKESVNSFAAEAELSASHRQDDNISRRVNWVVDTGRQALRDISIFWRNISSYSAAPIPKYLWLSCVFLGDRANAGSHAPPIRTLEHFWHAIEIPVSKWRESSDKILCICAKAEGILPPPRNKATAKRVLKQELPAPDAVCQAAVVALIFLLRRLLSLKVPDMYYLLSSSLGRKEPNITQLLPILQEDLDLDIGTNFSWASVSSASILPNAFATSSTKFLSFPDTLPEYQTDYSYMDIYQPHGSPPSSKSSCAVWGARKDPGTWRSVASLSSLKMAENLDQGLRKAINSPEFSPRINSHWIHILQLVYKLGVNNGRLIIRDTARDIERLRYKNCANPSTSSANVLLMCLNHFDHFGQMTKTLRDEIGNIPNQWESATISEAMPPTWVKNVTQDCSILQEEISVLREETKVVRKMILEQHSLLGSRRTTLLTILASIFVPMNFVASIFGMNAKEINGSNWHIKYYPIASLPLAVVTVLLPLIILPAINFASRHLAAHSMLRTIIHWTWIIFTLVLIIIINTIAMVYSSEHSQIPDTLYNFDFVCAAGLLGTISLALVVYAYRFFRGLTRCWSDKTERKAYWNAKKWWFGFWWLILCFWVIDLRFGYIHAVRILEIIPYLIYFSYVCWRWKKQAVKGKRSKGDERLLGQDD